jgi:nicotinate-nucleotide pyrophosphorylase (carboxylating)
MAKEFQQTAWDAAVEADCRQIVRLGVLEDLDRGYDWTTLALIGPDAHAEALVRTRQDGVIAGLPAVEMVLDEMDRRLRIEPLVRDGQPIAAGQALARLAGPARSLLTAERLVLNLLGRLSGIATLTRRYVDLVRHTAARIYDTRKTTPGWRRLEKYAVRQGGGANHRTGLFDAILIKDNHLAVGQPDVGRPLSPAEAVGRARAFLSQQFADQPAQAEMIVEVEVDSLDQLEAVLPAGPDIVLLDNMSPDMLRRAVTRRNVVAPAVQLEASGGINLMTVSEIAATGVERISVGALTHAAASLDVGLDWGP